MIQYGIYMNILVSNECIYVQYSCYIVLDTCLHCFASRFFLFKWSTTYSLRTIIKMPLVRVKWVIMVNNYRLSSPFVNRLCSLFKISVKKKSFNLEQVQIPCAFSRFQYIHFDKREEKHKAPFFWPLIQFLYELSISNNVTVIDSKLFWLCFYFFNPINLLSVSHVWQFVLSKICIGKWSSNGFCALFFWHYK